MGHATQRASWLFNISESIAEALTLTYKLSNVLIELTHLKDQPRTNKSVSFFMRAA